MDDDERFNAAMQKALSDFDQSLDPQAAIELAAETTLTCDSCKRPYLDDEEPALNGLPRCIVHTRTNLGGWVFGTGNMCSDCWDRFVQNNI